MKIAYCGYDFFHACLEALIADGHELVELFTFPTDNEYDFNDNVLKLAQAAKTRITMSPLGQTDLERLRQMGVELLITAAYPYKIPPWNGYVKYAVNVHPSLLPIGRGIWPLPWIILKGHRETGVTVHELSAGWDTGDILAQERLAVSEHETLESLSIRSQLAAKRLLRDTIRNIDTAWRAKRPQIGGETWHMPAKMDRTIEWTMNVAEIDRICRAFSKFEPFVFIDGIRHFVHKIDFWQEEHGQKPGTMVHKTNREMVYAAADGFVVLSSYVKAPETTA